MTCDREGSETQSYRFLFFLNCIYFLSWKENTVLTMVLKYLGSHFLLMLLINKKLWSLSLKQVQSQKETFRYCHPLVPLY